MVPVLILWFGIGEVPAVLTAFLISFFPIVVNVATGLATTEPELEDVRSRIAADLQTERLSELRRGWLRDLRKRSRIQVHERLLETLR